MEIDVRSKVLSLYFSSTFFVILLLCWNYFRQIDFEDSQTIFFSLFAYLSYGVLFLLPAVIITRSVHWIFAWWGKRYGKTIQWPKMAVYTVAVLTTSATIIFLFADQIVYRLFSFHINGFVWNLVTTPGGIESMGATGASSFIYGAIIVSLIILQILLLPIINFLFIKGGVSKAKLFFLNKKRFLLVIFCMAILQCLMYGMSNLQNHLPILNAARVFPFYQPLTFRSLAQHFGYLAQRNPRIPTEQKGGHLNYPRTILAIEKPEKSLNIIWLVAESWRWDMVTPEIMPATWAFAQKARFFKQHYSGGNGTRMGMFSMFYGLYGPDWFRFLDERRSPVIMDILQEQDYQLSMYTSAKFSYPEFDQTIFSKIPVESLHEADAGQGWQRDRKNVTDMFSFIENRDTDRPFISFMFFESPHARYYFPPEDAIREPYLEDFNYASMSLERDIELIYNRYVNSCHHLDSQFARVIDFLQDEGLLDSTIVILTGDHGEEFLENGHWGHNSGFSEQQVRVPLILWIPGSDHKEETGMTSHLDIIPTILPILGVKSPPESYSLGYNLIPASKREYTVIGDWSRISYIDNEFKAVFPFSNKALNQSYFTTKDDQKLTDTDIFWQSRREIVVDVMKNLNSFHK